MRTYKVWGVIGTLALVSGSWFFYRQPQRLQLSYDFDILILLVFALGVFIRQFPRNWNPQGIETMAVTLFGLIYVAWLGNFITRINFASPHGRYFIMLLVVVTKFTDMGAYIVGSIMGRAQTDPAHQPEENVKRYHWWRCLRRWRRIYLSLGYAGGNGPVDQCACGSRRPAAGRGGGNR